MTEGELQDWIDEGMSILFYETGTQKIRSVGDRVQWFRGEAEMQRWLEELEIKLADFLRCIRSFRRMSQVCSSCDWAF
jgi:hypothetical protein